MPFGSTRSGVFANFWQLKAIDAKNFEPSRHSDEDYFSADETYAEKIKRWGFLFKSTATNILRNAFEIFKKAASALLDLNFLLLKGVAIVESIAFVAVQIIPFTIMAALAKLFRREQTAKNLLTKAYNIAENNVRIGAVAWLARQAVNFINVASLRGAMRVVASNLPVMTTVVLATAASLWTYGVQRRLNSLAYKLGFSNDEIFGPFNMSSDHDRRLREDYSNHVQFGGAVVASGVASLVAAPVMLNVAGSALVAAAGAQLGKSAYDLYKSRYNDNSNDFYSFFPQDDLEQEEDKTNSAKNRNTLRVDMV